MAKFLKKLQLNFILPALILGAAIFIAYTITIQAQTASTTTDNGSPAINIAFPIPELGNCTSKDDCKNYCNDSSHIQACIDFAKSHGLMNSQEAGMAKKFSQALRGGAGPGGCTTPEQCQNFCSDISNLQVCLDFAKSHGITNDDTRQALKIQAYIQGGGKMPGNCTSKESCEKYCGDFSHAEECYNFAKSAGIIQNQGASQANEQGPSPEMMQKFTELAQQGLTPGQCKTKDDCENYCQDASHRQECVDFGVKVGFIKPDQAQKIIGLDGKGPGGCDSTQSCSTYCSDTAHQDECLTFGEDHGFITDEQGQNVKDGLVQIRAGIEHASPEVKSCIETLVGTSTIQNIESGALTPGPDISDNMKGCFEKFGKHFSPAETFKNMPAAVQACVKDKIGSALDGILSGVNPPTPDQADIFRGCFRENQFQMKGGGETPSFQNILNNAPPEVQSCLKEKLGDTLNNIASDTTAISPETKDIFRSCFEDLHFQDFQQESDKIQGFNPDEFQQQEKSSSIQAFQHMIENAPQGLLSCFKDKIGGDLQNTASQAQGNPDIAQKIKSCISQFKFSMPTPMPPSQINDEGNSLPMDNGGYNNSQKTEGDYGMGASGTQAYPMMPPIGQPGSTPPPQSPPSPGTGVQYH